LTGYWAAAFSRLREVAPDMVAGHELLGLGRKWFVSMYSEKEKLVVEICGSEVPPGKRDTNAARQYEKFQSVLLKLVDIRARDRTIKAVMAWKGMIPAHPVDVGLCTAWGVYVVSGRKAPWKDIINGAPPSAVNRNAIPFLTRKRDAPRQGMRWLTEERRRTVVELLKQSAMGTREIAEAIGLDYVSHRAEVSSILRELEREGIVRRLMPGYVRGIGAIYGTDKTQLDTLEKGLFRRYRQGKRTQRIAERVLQLLREEGRMTYAEILRRLQERWGIATDRNVLVAILVKNLRRRGLVRSEEGSGGLEYSVELAERGGNQG
jgi:transposase